MTNKIILQDIKRDFSKKGVKKIEDLLSELIYDTMVYDHLNEDTLNPLVYISEREKEELVNSFFNELKKYDNSCFYEAIKKAVDEFNTDYI